MTEREFFSWGFIGLFIAISIFLAWKNTRPKGMFSMSGLTKFMERDIKERERKDANWIRSHVDS